MNQTDQSKWNDANQRYLMASINLVKVELEAYKSKIGNTCPFDYEQQATLAREKFISASDDMPAPSALDNLCAVFGLTDFERNILLVAAGIELESDFDVLVSSIQGGAQTFLPTFSLVLTALPEAHWSAIIPNAPLRFWGLIEIHRHQSTTKSSFQIDEQILNYLIGLYHINESLAGLVEPCLRNIDLVSSQKNLANKISQHIGRQKDNYMELPIIQLNGDDLQDKLNIASNVCSQTHRVLYTLQVLSIPENAREIWELTKLWNRETYLGVPALFLDCSEVDKNETVRLQKIIRFCKNITGLLFIGCRQWSPDLDRQKYVFQVHPPTSKEQLSIWEHELGKDANLLDGHLAHITSQFRLDPQAIREASTEIQRVLVESKLNDDNNIDTLKKAVWKACCIQTRPRLDDLAQRIEPMADWEDIVLPAFQKQILHEIASHIRHRVKVYEEWGFGAKSFRGLGLSVLFTGESGTGKTMASEILAKALQLDLYKIDLSQVVNKYIGETEKNLKKVFDAAEAGGAVLLFDEADALFGKRSEVRDSHDRYANIEVSYLLQRMETYRGLAILTTNLKSAMDKAFLRRIRFIVQFPFPDNEQRAEIWRRTFPPATPLENIDVNRLARLNITGGNIKNIALNAAFIAAESNGAIRMEHVEKAAQNEYAKLEKPMSNLEKGTW